MSLARRPRRQRERNSTVDSDFVYYDTPKRKSAKDSTFESPPRPKSKPQAKATPNKSTHKKDNVTKSKKGETQVKAITNQKVGKASKQERSEKDTQVELKDQYSFDKKPTGSATPKRQRKVPAHLLDPSFESAIPRRSDDSGPESKRKRVVKAVTKTTDSHTEIASDASNKTDEGTTSDSEKEEITEEYVAETKTIAVKIPQSKMAIKHIDDQESLESSDSDLDVKYQSKKKAENVISLPKRERKMPALLRDTSFVYSEGKRKRGEEIDDGENSERETDIKGKKRTKPKMIHIPENNSHSNDTKLTKAPKKPKMIRVEENSQTNQSSSKRLLQSLLEPGLNMEEMENYDRPASPVATMLPQKPKSYVAPPRTRRKKKNPGYGKEAYVYFGKDSYTEKEIFGDESNDEEQTTKDKEWDEDDEVLRPYKKMQPDDDFGKETLPKDISSPETSTPFVILPKGASISSAHSVPSNLVSIMPKLVSKAGQGKTLIILRGPDGQSTVLPQVGSTSQTVAGAKGKGPLRAISITELQTSQSLDPSSGNTPIKIIRQSQDGGMSTTKLIKTDSGISYVVGKTTPTPTVSGVTPQPATIPTTIQTLSTAGGEKKKVVIIKSKQQPLASGQTKYKVISATKEGKMILSPIESAQSATSAEQCSVKADTPVVVSTVGPTDASPVKQTSPVVTIAKGGKVILEPVAEPSAVVSNATTGVKLVTGVQSVLPGSTNASDKPKEIKIIKKMPNTNEQPLKQGKPATPTRFVMVKTSAGTKLVPISILENRGQQSLGPVVKATPTEVPVVSSSSGVATVTSAKTVTSKDKKYVLVPTSKSSSYVLVETNKDNQNSSEKNVADEDGDESSSSD